MHSDDRIRLQHMIDAGNEAIGFASGRCRADLNTNRMLVLSLVKSVEILGEAASKVSEELRKPLSRRALARDGDHTQPVDSRLF